MMPNRFLFRSEPSRDVPFADIRLPPVNSAQHKYEEGEDVEVGILFQFAVFVCHIVCG